MNKAYLTVLFLPGDDFAVVLSGVSGLTLEVLSEIKPQLDEFAEKCGAKAALVSNFLITTDLPEAAT